MTGSAGSLCAAPLRSAIVALKCYGKGQNDIHACRKRRAHLLLLTPDNLSVYTSSDAGTAESSLTAASRKLLSLKHSNRFMQRLKSKGLSDENMSSEFGLQKMRKSESTSSLMNRASEEDSSDEEDELLEGQIFRIGVSLNQILSVEIHNGSEMVVFYQPNKPTKRSIIEQNKVYLYKNLMDAVDTLGSAMYKKDNKSKADIFGKYPDAHHFLVKFSKGEDPVEFKSEICNAQDRFQQAMVWLGRCLPLNDQSHVIMVTVGYQDSLDRFCHPRPSLNDLIELPLHVGKAIAKQDSRYLDMRISIYLSTPIGPATATVSLMEIERSDKEGHAPIQSEAILENPPGAPEGYKWTVTVEWAAKKTKIIGKLDSREIKVQQSQQQKRSISSRQRAVVPRKSTMDGAKAMVFLSIIKGSVAVARRIGPRASEINLGKIEEERERIRKAHNWEFRLLEIDTYLEPKAVNLVARKISTTSGPVQHLTSHDIPLPFQYLVKEHPGVITPDLVRRFVIGLDSETKAFNAMQQMLDYFSKRNLTNILYGPQTSFHDIKDSYLQGFIGWNAKKDCLLEIELLGQFPESYKQITSKGIKEDQILDHLLFTNLYAFKFMDNRPLPHGKTIKILDLDGLTMSHLKTPGFKFITRAGAEIATMFPQRLHKCFVVNVPGWWSMAWRLISPMIPEKVRKQMHLFGKNVRNIPSIHISVVLTPQVNLCFAG